MNPFRMTREFFFDLHPMEISREYSFAISQEQARGSREQIKVIGRPEVCRPVLCMNRYSYTWHYSRVAEPGFDPDFLGIYDCLVRVDGRETLARKNEKIIEVVLNDLSSVSVLLPFWDAR